MKPFDFNTPLDALELKFKEIKNIAGVEKEFEFLTGENAHAAASLLMAIHYGSPEDVKLIKELISKQDKTPRPNRADMRRIKLTGEFIKIHKERLRLYN